MSIKPSLDLVQKLKESIDALDDMIVKTIETLTLQKQFDIVTRVKQYETISSNIKHRIVELEGALVAENYSEVARLVKIINGSSTMITSDAKDILISGNLPANKSELQ